jgi:hypothetical protein
MLSVLVAFRYRLRKVLLDMWKRAARVTTGH